MTFWKNYQKPSSEEEVQQKLDKLQFEVTQHEATERAFNNAYWDHKEEGIYVDVLSGEPLFASVHKFDSGTGWPSFYQPIYEDQLVRREDRSLWMSRVEIRSRLGDNHLGHVFEDGPAPTGLRYCMNSASLRFVPRAQMAAEGYAEVEAKIFLDKT